jgi:hypothetical protein
VTEHQRDQFIFYFVVGIVWVVLVLSIALTMVLRRAS